MYSIVAPLTGKVLDKGVDCMTLLGSGSFIISFAYLLLAPVPPLAMEPSLVQISIGRVKKRIDCINFVQELVFTVLVWR